MKNKTPKILTLLLLILLASTTFAIVDTNLVSWYRLDETSGTTSTDSKGDYNGTILEGVTLGATGKLGTAYSFNGDTNGVNYGALDVNGAVSISAWVYSEPRDSESWGLIFGRWNNPASSLKFSLHALGQYADFGVGADEFSMAMAGSDTGIFGATGWHHIVGTWDGNLEGVDNVLIYVDGVLQSTPTALSGLAQSQPDVNTMMGEGQPGFPALSDWNGKVDEVAVWNKALDAEDVSDLYASGAGVTYCGENVFAASCDSEPTTASIDFNIYADGNNVHLSGVSMDCNSGAYTFSNQTSPKKVTFDINTYSCTFSKTSYDSNTVSVNADVNKTMVIYLTPTVVPPAPTPADDVNVNLSYFSLMANNSSKAGAGLTSGIASQSSIMGLALGITVVISLVMGVVLLSLYGVVQGVKTVKKVR